MAYPPFHFTDELRPVILDLAQQPDIHSVSCPFDDFLLWKGLLQEQVRRSRQAGLAPQDAFWLCGPDSGVPGITSIPGLLDDDEQIPVTPDRRTGGYASDMWGGKVHVPYEGTTQADLLILPQWHNTFPSKPDAKFHGIAGSKRCNYLLTNRNLGELNGAIRTIIADCYLYKNTGPYIDCHPRRYSPPHSIPTTRAGEAHEALESEVVRP